MGTGEGEEWDLRGTFTVGAYFKIEEYSGKLWTAKIVRVEADKVHFLDRDGEPVGKHRDEIKNYRRIRGDEHGN
jgi:hypothetical protein